MIRIDPGHLLLGRTADDSPPTLDLVDGTDPETDPVPWSFSYTSGDHTLTLTADDGDGGTPFRVTTSGTTRVDDLRVDGSVLDPVQFDGDTTHVTGFNGDGEHWVYSDTDGGTSDPILYINRVASSEYELYVSEGDTTERVLTDGSAAVDASTLGGDPADAFVLRDGSRALTGDLTVGEGNALHGGSNVISFFAAGDNSTLDTDGSGGGWHVWDTALDEIAFEVQEDGDVRIPNRGLTVSGNSVLTTASDVGIDAENDNDTPLVENVDAIHAGTDLAFSDDGDGTVTLGYAGGSGTTSAAVGDDATASGDGTQTTFTLDHSLGSTPDSVSVTPTSDAASTDFTVENITSTTVDVTYPVAPPDGTDNLSWSITTVASGLEGTSVSDDDTPILTGPDDFNFGTYLNVNDDGDGSVTVGVTGEVATTDASETVTETWTHDAPLNVTADNDLALTNASTTTQFAWAYESGADRAVFADRANALDVIEVDRAGTVNFPENLQVGGTDVATTSDDLANTGSGDAEDGEVPEADGNGNIQWTRRTHATTVTTSGDDSTTTFALPHEFGATPGHASVQALSPAAMSDFRVVNKTSSDVVIEYATAPPNGTDNLEYDVLTHI